VHAGNTLPCQSGEDVPLWVSGCQGMNQWGQHVAHLAPGQHCEGEGFAVSANAHEPAVTPCTVKPCLNIGG